MKAIFAAFAAMIVISVIAHFGLQGIGFSSADQNSSASVRLD